MVIWEDHTRMDRQPLKGDVENLVVTSMSTGILLKRTKKWLVIASDIERYEDRDDCTYMIILRKAVLGMQEFGEVEINNLRIAP